MTISVALCVLQFICQTFLIYLNESMATSFIQLLFSIQHKYNVFKSLKEPINPTEVTVKKMFL